MSGGRLVVLDRAGRDAKQYALAEGLATLGNDLACDIRLMLPAVSPHHATVRVQANQTVVQSVSEGVTLLNDVPVSVAILRHGDIISIGGRALRWEYSQPQHRPTSKPQPAILAINKTQSRGKGQRSRSSDPLLHNPPVNKRTSMPASCMKQVAIVQPQRRDITQGEPSDAPELTDLSQIENTENENSQEPNTRKSTRPSKQNLQANTKASEWIESRKSNSRQSLIQTRTRHTLTPSDLQPRSKSASRLTHTQNETQLRSKSLASIPLDAKVEISRPPVTPKLTRSKVIERTPITIDETNSSIQSALTPKESRDVCSRPLIVTPVETKVTSMSRTQKVLTPRDNSESIMHTPTQNALRTTPRQPQSNSKPLEPTLLQTKTEEKSTTRATPTVYRPHASTPLTTGLTKRGSRNSSRLPISKSAKQLTITPTETHETTRSRIVVERKDILTPLNRSTSLLPRMTPIQKSSRLLSRTTPRRTLLNSSKRSTMASLTEKRILPPRARTLTPRAQAFVANKSSVTPLRTWRDTSLRSTVLRKTHRPIKIQAPTSIDHTKQAAIMLMTRHTKSKSPNAVSIVVTKPSPLRKTLKRSSRSPKGSLAKKRNTSVQNISDEVSTRTSLSCPSARKSVMKSTLKDPSSARKNESIKFDLSNLENDNKHNQLGSDGTVDTINQSFENGSCQYDSPSPRRSIYSRSSRIIEKTLGIPMTLVETIETSITTSPKSRSTRGSLIVQKALEEFSLKSQSNTSGQANLTKTLSPRAETYSIVDLVSCDSNITEYNTIDSTPFGTPRSHKKTRSLGAPLPSSTPYKVPNKQGLKDDVESLEIITPQNNENNKPVASTKVSKRSRSRSRLNDSEFLLEDDDSPRTSKRTDKSATTSFDISHLKRKLSQSLTESDEGSDKSETVYGNAPKNSLTNVRIKELFAKSPKNDLRSVSGVKTLFKSVRKQKTPKNSLEDVKGIKRLFMEKSPKNTLENISEVKTLFRRSPRNDLRLSGVKDALRVRSPRNDLTDVRGVRHLYRLEKERYSSNVSGIQELFKENTDLDTTFDLLMGKYPLRTYKAASAHKIKPKSKVRKAKSLYDSTSIHPEDWLNKNVITVYNEKNLPLKKRSIKTLKSTPVKANANVTLNSTELCQISPIIKLAPVSTAGNQTIDTSGHKNSTKLGRSTRSSKQTRSMNNNGTSNNNVITEEKKLSLVVHKKAPVVKTVRKTRQRRVSERSETIQNGEILEPVDQNLKTSDQKVSPSVPRTRRRKSLAKRVSIVIKTTRTGKSAIRTDNETEKNSVENDEASNSKVLGTQNKVPKRKARLLPKATQIILRSRPASIVIPLKTPLASAKKTGSKMAVLGQKTQTKKTKVAQVKDTSPATRKRKNVDVQPADNTEKPKRGRKKKAEMNVEETKQEEAVQSKVKTRGNVIEKPDTIEKTKTRSKGKVTVAQKTVMPPRTSRKKKSPDATLASNEDIEKPKRGRRNLEPDNEKPKSGIKKLKTNIEVPNKRSVIPKADIEKPKRGRKNPESDIEKPKRGKKHPELDIEKPKRGRKNPEPHIENPNMDRNQKQDIEKPKSGKKTSEPDIENPKRGRKNPEPQIEKPNMGSNPELDIEKPKRGKKNPEPDIEKPKRGKKNPEPDNEKPKRGKQNPEPDIEKPKRGRKKLLEKNTLVPADSISEAKAISSNAKNKIAQPKGKKFQSSVGESLVLPTRRKRKSPDVTPTKEEASMAAKRRKATEVTVPARTTRSKAVSDTKPKPRGQKR